MENDCFLEHLTQMNEAALESGGGGLRSVGYAELAENVIDVALDGCFADTQAGAYFFIALTSHNELEDFHFSARQIRAGHSLDQALGYGRWNVTRSAVYGSDRRLKFFEEHVLQ